MSGPHLPAAAISRLANAVLLLVAGCWVEATAPVAPANTTTTKNEDNFLIFFCSKYVYNSKNILQKQFFIFTTE